MTQENVYNLARKAFALLLLGYEPLKNESLEGFVSRCEYELKKTLSEKREEERYAETGA